MFFLFHLFSCLSFFSNTNLVLTNILDRPDSYDFTSTLHQQMDISPKHVLYIGDKWNLPISTIRPSELSSIISPSCHSNPYYDLLVQSKDKHSLCIYENKIAHLLNHLQHSSYSFEIIVDDPLLLEEDSVYRLLDQKHRVRRILQFDLDTDNFYYSPHFVDHIIYFWNSNRNPI